MIAIIHIMSETLFLKEKSFSFFFNIQQNRSEFLSSKNIFLIITKQIWIFVIKNHLFKYYKTYLMFWINKNHFFKILQNRSDFLTKEETSFINKFMWFSFVSHVQHIIHDMHKWYIGHKSLEDQTLFGRMGA